MVIFVAVRRDRFDGKHNAGYLGLDHALHGHREANLDVVVARFLAVEDGAAFEERGPAGLHGRHDVVRADDVEEGALLAGEARLGQVFGGCRTAHRDRPLAELVVRLADLRGDVRGIGASMIRWRMRLGAVVQHARIVDIEAEEFLLDDGFEARSAG